MNQLLTLCLIVKNESHGIAQTLNSIKQYIDSWCILDTGSEDNTKEIIQKELENISGKLFESKFVDFATTRNELLTIARSNFNSEFLLLLDADDIVHNGEELRKFLEQSRMISINDLGGFNIRINEGNNCDWISTRIIRRNSGWHYTCPVHEVLIHSSGQTSQIIIPNVSIEHKRGQISLEKMHARLERDAELLKIEIEKDPSNARATFYLAQTYKRAGIFDKAIEYFQKRIELGGWYEEVFESKFEIGKLTSDYQMKTIKLLDAYSFSPHRAEPLAELAEHLRHKSPQTAFMFARRAYELPYPKDILFIDKEVYEWRTAALCSATAWYVGEWKFGEEATKKALEKVLDEGWRKVLERNLELYLNKLNYHK